MSTGHLVACTRCHFQYRTSMKPGTTCPECGSDRFAPVSER